MSKHAHVVQKSITCKQRKLTEITSNNGRIPFNVLMCKCLQQNGKTELVDS